MCAVGGSCEDVGTVSALLLVIGCCRPILHTGVDKLRLVHLTQSRGHSKSKTLTSGEGGYMDPLNPEWNFLKDLLGEKSSWKQLPDTQNCGLGKASWPDLCCCGESRLRGEDGLMVLAFGKQPAWNSTCGSGDGKVGWVQC